MKLTLFAATGGVGRHVLEEALAAGHEVTAVVRHPGGLPRAVRVVQADLSSPDAARLESAVEGADAVISCLGPRKPSDAGVTARGTQAIIQAMKAAGVRRIAVVSAAPVSTTPSPGRPNPPRHDPAEGFFTRHLLTPLIKRLLAGVYADLARMEDLLRDSGLDWTVVRPPRLTNGPRRGSCREAFGQNLRGGLSISRADVAHFMLSALRRPETIHQAVGIAF
jgi:putative NADH-flavin reductase